MDKQKEPRNPFMRSTRKIRLSDGVYGRIIREGNKRPELAIIIDIDTTAEQLRNAWGAISHAQQYLFNLVGTDMDDLVTTLRFGKAAMHIKQGYSYAEIALEVNHDTLVHLCGAVIKLNSGNQKDALENFTIAKIHLKAMRMKEDEIHNWLFPALSEIKEGRAPWTLTHGPVDKQRVRDSIRQLERELVSEKVKIVNPPKTKRVRLGDLPKHPGLDMANELLSREPDLGGLEKLNEAIKRDMVRRVENPG